MIDDDREDSDLMKELLSGAGYEVVVASDGSQAMDSLKGDGFDLLLIDIKMPTLSGYDLLRLMRERLNHKVKMIYVSIVPEQEVDMTDIDGFVQKPFSPEKLIEGVRAVIG